MAGNHQLALRALCFFLCAAGLLQAQQSPRLATRSTSSSGQFFIYSQDATWRSQIARRSDDAREVWIKALSLGDEWKIPIIIQDQRGAARPKGNPRAVTAVYESDGGALKIQIDIYDASLLGGEGFETEVFRALGLERTYRDHPLQSGKMFHLPPQWMIEALGEVLRVEKRGSPEGVYEALLRSDRPPKIEDFLKERPDRMEATSLALYRTQALALLRALSQLPDSGKSYEALLSSIANEDPSLKSLLAAFPSLNGDASNLGKLWTLSIARGSTSRRAEPLSVAETEQQLSGILAVSAPADPKNPGGDMVTGPEALPLIARSTGGPFLMRQKSAELLTLEARSHPVMRPIVAEYRTITSLLAEKPKRNLTKRIEEAGKIRDLLKQRTGSVEDYLNWFEATRLDTLSDDFIDITESPSASPRTDPITQHLDAVERRGW